MTTMVKIYYGDTYVICPRYECHHWFKLLSEMGFEYVIELVEVEIYETPTYDKR